MKVKEFIDSVRVIINTNKNPDDEIEFMYSSEESKFLYGFRSRHDSGYYENHQYKGSADRYRYWSALLGKDQILVEMYVTNISTIITKKMLLKVANIIIDEVNDMLLQNYGKNAILHEKLVDPMNLIS